MPSVVSFRAALLEQTEKLVHESRDLIVLLARRLKHVNLTLELTVVQTLAMKTERKRLLKNATWLSHLRFYNGLELVKVIAERPGSLLESAVQPQALVDVHFDEECLH